jgi:hypothetical protein
MSITRTILLITTLLLTATAGPTATAATAFTYGGRLTDGATLAFGSYDLRFSLFTAPAGGVQVAPAVTKEDLQLTNGIFTVELDFGPDAVSGEPRWLEIAVRPGGSAAGFTVLSPRHELTTSPYALFAQVAGSVSWTNIAGTPSQFYGAGPGLGLSGTNFYILPAGVDNSMIADQAVTADKIAPGQVVKSINSYKDTVTLEPGDNILLNPLPQGLEVAAVDLWKTTGNGRLTPANFLGTVDRQPLDLRVNNTRALSLQPTDGTPNVIAGFSGNHVITANLVMGAAIAGGGADADLNRVAKSYGTVGGGTGNLAGNDDDPNPYDGRFATVGGGMQNRAAAEAAHVGGGKRNVATGELSNVSAGGYNQATGYAATVGGGGGIDPSLGSEVPNIATGYWSVIGGGLENVTTNNCSTVAGGSRNKAVAIFSSIGGGRNNVASGAYSTIPGGQGNKAEGLNSFAAGLSAYAKHDGSFVWADGSGSEDFTSATSNEFAVRALGGVRFVSSAQGNGVILSPGSGSWANLSDRAAKTNFGQIDSRQILEAVAALPIQTWTYKDQAASIRHIGPAAQDFSAAFNVGDDNRHISAVDADGVALAAIQGLYQMLREKEAQLQEKAVQLSAHEKCIEQLQQRLEALERASASRNSN